MDITDQAAAEKIHTWIRTRDLELDTLYVSNIVEWLQDDWQKREAFHDNMKSLTTAHTRMIDAKKPAGQTNVMPTQQIAIGQEAVLNRLKELKHTEQPVLAAPPTPAEK